MIVERGVVTLFSWKHLLFNFGRLGFLYGKSHWTHFTNTFLQNGIASSVRFAPMTAVFAMSTIPIRVRYPQEYGTHRSTAPTGVRYPQEYGTDRSTAPTGVRYPQEYGTVQSIEKMYNGG